MNAENLTQLTIQMCCTNLLPIVGQNCVKLKFMEILDNTTDESFKWIIPTDGEHGCPALQTLIINWVCAKENDRISDHLKVDLLNKFPCLRVYACETRCHFDLRHC